VLDSEELACILCQSGFLLDQREASQSPGECIPVEACSGISKPEEDGIACVDMACASIAHCSLCGEDEAVCADCENGYKVEEVESEAGVVQECKKTGLSGGAIAGIVIAAIVVIALVVFLCVWFLVCKKKKAGAAA